MAHLHPGSVAHHGLGSALETYAAQAFRRADVSYEIAVDPDVGEQHDALLYSLARELLGNAAKHSGASRVRVHVVRDGSSVRLCVSDDRIGITEEAMASPGHFGLLTAHHRVAAAGGHLQVVSAPGEGARVEVVLPEARDPVSPRGAPRRAQGCR